MKSVKSFASSPVPGKRPPRNRGFALVVSVLLMALLTVIALGLLSLSSISLRSVSNEQWMREARQNSRLALMLALGELQSATGPDQRITAPAGILGSEVVQPHLTGVWQGWKWDGTGNPPDFSEEKKSRFLRWLVSARGSGDAGSLDMIQSPPGGDSISLVRGGSDPEDRVDASIVPVSTDSGIRRQGFAWAIFDESTKLPLSLPETEDESPLAAVRRMAAAPLPGYGSTARESWAAFGEIGGERFKLLTPEQAALVGAGPGDRSFHDVTSRSAGLAVDVAKGGLSVDLSRLFDDPNGLPADYARRHLYSGTDTPLVSLPARFPGANPFPSPDPSWRLLRSHYRLYNELSGDHQPSIANSLAARPPPGSTGAAVANHNFFHSQQIAPVIAKAQFVFSLSFGWHNMLNNVARPGNDGLPEAQRDHYVTWLVIDPVITLWNPYNVHLRFTGGRIDLYRVPLAFRLYKNGQLINPEYTHLANTFLGGGDFNNRAGTFYRLNLLPPDGSKDILLAPGEHIVLTSTNHVKHTGHQYQNQGLDLRPGFSPPAGNSSIRTVGGTSTLNVCVSADGQPNGRDYGRAVRSIAVKPGDRMQLEIQPRRAQVDKPLETGGKEVSGMLKYYVGPPNAPRLVGGIELDYGDDEAEYLPAFPQDDLPSIVVSSEIPKRVKADDYQGSNPPPVVRFKEPFLISTFQLKTERDSKFPSRGWLHNSPVNFYASAGLDQKEPWAAHQFEFQWEVMTDWPPSSPTVEISNTGNRGYGGSGVYAQTGQEFATHAAIPVAPALSIPQLRHAPLNVGGQLPLTSQIVANSFPSPLMDASLVRGTAGERAFLDHSYFANASLFDHTFFSGLADRGGSLDAGSPDARSALAAFFKGESTPPNPRLLPYGGGRDAGEIADALTASDGHLKTAAHLLIDCPFNVNSTRVDVWEALLSSNFGAEVPLNGSGGLHTSKGDGIPSLRHLPTNGPDVESQNDPVSLDHAKWNGHRRLKADQIRRLAEEVVVEIQARGPFQSLAEFVNRRPENGPLGRSGALQAALERSDINDIALDPASHVTANPGAVNPSAGEGNTADGAPGILTQADLLTPIAPILTARGDTFRIRAYGEAGPSDGRFKARAWCEAIVQRIPEYLQAAASEPWEAPAGIVNQRFGRRYEIVGFRWLSQSEL